MTTLDLYIALAFVAMIFTTALWNTARSVATSGGLRTAHLSSTGSTIALMMSLALNAPLVFAQAFAVALIFASLALLAWERLPIWPICLMQASFGALFALGLPFAHA